MDWKNKDKNAPWRRFNVLDLPTLAIATWQGEKIEIYEDEKDTPSLIKWVPYYGRKYSRDLPWSIDLTAANQRAREEKRLLAVTCLDKAEEERLRDPALWSLVKDYAWARVAADSEEAKRLALTMPSILLLDTEEKPLLRIAGLENLKDLRKRLEDFAASRAPQ